MSAVALSASKHQQFAHRKAILFRWNSVNLSEHYKQTECNSHARYRVIRDLPSKELLML
jgi:hypothetical protein